MLDAGGDPADPAAAEAAARALRPEDLERGDLRGPVADAAAAAVAAIPAVRAALLDFQRGFATERGAVLDGRDIGTVIFPDAPVKLYVTASLPSARGAAGWSCRRRGSRPTGRWSRPRCCARDTRDAPNMRPARGRGRARYDRAWTRRRPSQRGMAASSARRLPAANAYDSGDKPSIGNCRGHAVANA